MGQLWLSCKLEASWGISDPAAKSFTVDKEVESHWKNAVAHNFRLDTAPPEKLSAAVGELGKGSMHELGLEDGGG